MPVGILFSSFEIIFLYLITTKPAMKKIICLLVFLVAPLCYGQSGSLDINFAPYGVYMGGTPSQNYGYIYDVALQADGKIIIVGMFHHCNGYPANNIARLNSDGSFDSSFNIGSGTDILSGWSISSVAVQSDGKILIAGIFTSYNGTPAKNIARLNPDGSIDTSFVTVGPTQSDYGYTQISKIIYQPENGKITVAGYFTKWDTTTISNIIRLNPDGTLDSTFQQRMSTGGISTMAYQSDGKILIGGYLGQVNGINSRGLARLNANRSYDPTFAIQYINQSVFDIIVQPDQKIIVSGNYTAYGSTPIDGLMRLNPDGSLDTSFSTTTSHGGTIFLQPDGKILVGRGGVERYNSDGSLDTSFASGTITAINNDSAYPYAFAIQPDERIIVVGLFSTYNGFSRRSIARINGDLLGVNQYDKNPLTIYPNPTDSVLNLQLTNTFTIDKVIIIDISGKILQEETQNTNQLNVENLSAGIYIIKAFSENQIFQTKFVKQ